MEMEQTDWTDLRGIANDFVMPVGEILNSKKETVCSDLIVSVGWVTRAGHQERGHGWRVRLSQHRESSHHTWVLQLSTVLCLQGAGGEQVKEWICAGLDLHSSHDSQPATTVPCPVVLMHVPDPAHQNCWASWHSSGVIPVPCRGCIATAGESCT